MYTNIDTMPSSPINFNARPFFNLSGSSIQQALDIHDHPAVNISQ
jgi:hypothetical protein